MHNIGLQPLVSERTRTVVMHRLIVECYGSSMLALKIKNEAVSKGAKAFVFREGDTICVSAGSYMEKGTAERERKRLAGKGIATRHAEASITMPVWQVTAGRFTDLRKTEDVLQTLAAQGIEAEVEPIDK